jgi:hypothetical protein
VGLPQILPYLIAVLTGLNTNKTPRPPAVGCGQIHFQSLHGNSGDDDGRITGPQRRSRVQGTLDGNTIQIDTMYQLLIQKGSFTEAEFLEKRKQVQADYQKSGHA